MAAADALNAAKTTSQSTIFFYRLAKIAAAGWLKAAVST